jgi:hypothetical protein
MALWMESIFVYMLTGFKQAIKKMIHRLPKINRPGYLFILIALSIITAGCYTQFTTLETNSNISTGQKSQVSDSVPDTLTQVPEKDTVYLKDHRICYWHRDFFGRRELRCYKSYYDADWYDYYNQPWWYGSNSSYYRPECMCNCGGGYSYGYGYCAGCEDCDDYCWWYCRSQYYKRPYYSGGGSSSGSGSSETGGGTPSVHPPRHPVRTGYPPSQTTRTVNETEKNTQIKQAPEVFSKPDTLKANTRNVIVPPDYRNREAPSPGLNIRELRDTRTTVKTREPEQVIESKPSNSYAPVKTVVDTAKSTPPPDRKRRSVRKW